METKRVALLLGGKKSEFKIKIITKQVCQEENKTKNKKKNFLKGSIENKSELFLFKPWNKLKGSKLKYLESTQRNDSVTNLSG